MLARRRGNTFRCRSAADFAYDCVRSPETHHMTHRLCSLLAAVLLCVASVARAETVTLASYNIEHFESRFEEFKLSRDKAVKEKAANDPLIKDLLDAERKQNEEDQWEIAQVISDPAFNPDVLVVEEGCSQSNLKFFNKRWLNNAYETAIVFQTNTDREQNLCMMLKPGFKILARKDKYFEEKDTVGN